MLLTLLQIAAFGSANGADFLCIGGHYAEEVKLRIDHMCRRNGLKQLVNHYGSERHPEDYDSIELPFKLKSIGRNGEVVYLWKGKSALYGWDYDAEGRSEEIRLKVQGSNINTCFRRLKSYNLAWDTAQDTVIKQLGNKDFVMVKQVKGKRYTLIPDKEWQRRYRKRWKYFDLGAVQMNIRKLIPGTCFENKVNAIVAGNWENRIQFWQDVQQIFDPRTYRQYGSILESDKNIGTHIFRGYKHYMKHQRDNKELDEDCPVCFEEYRGSTNKKVTKCGHILCTDCFPQLTECPLCRTELAN